MGGDAPLLAPHGEGDAGDGVPLGEVEGGEAALVGLDAVDAEEDGVVVVARQLHGQAEVLGDDGEDGPARGAVGAGAGDGLLDVLEDALEVVELAAGGAELGAGRGGDLVDVAPQGLGEELAEQGADHGVVQGVVELDEGAGLRLVQLEYVLGGEQRGTIQVRYQPFKNLVLFGTFGLV